MSRFLNVLRSWLVMVSIIAMGNTLQSFRDHTFLYEKLYTGKPDLVNGLQARTFGIWTLLSSVIRCLCAIDIRNKTCGTSSLPTTWSSGPPSDRFPKRRQNNPPTLEGHLKAPRGPCGSSPIQAPRSVASTVMSTAPGQTQARLYHITLWTFLLALGHFLSELFVYGTAAPTIGVLAPLMVASLSILGMLVGLRYLEVEPVSRQKKRN
uniref:Ergosterol biosynthesis 28-like protein n=1 Tax=Myotis myotis TaxID=51298 RepID=A0A7J8AJF0_MYOMY|nr:ergosterol biosynthesis 28-like protein [Myotis myotis]